MLQTLLTDRFRLVLRKDAQEIATHSLVMARDDGRIGPAMVRSAECEALRDRLKTAAGNGAASLLVACNA